MNIVLSYLLTLSPLSFLAAGNQPPPGCRAQATTTLTPSAPLATTWSHGELKSLAGWVDVRILKLNQNPKFSLTVLISVPYPLLVTRANLLQMHLQHSRCRYQMQWGWIGHRIATWPPAWQPSWNCADLASLALGSPWPLDWYPPSKTSEKCNNWHSRIYVMEGDCFSKLTSPLYHGCRDWIVLFSGGHAPQIRVHCHEGIDITSSLRYLEKPLFCVILGRLHGHALDAVL